MPEGPEIKRSADQLSQVLTGKAIVDAFPGNTGRYSKRPPEGFDAFIEEFNLRGSRARVLEVNCKGKFMWWRLAYPLNHTGPECDNDFWYVWITYGMSGQWTQEETSHSAFGVSYCSEETLFDVECNIIHPNTLYFNDVRHFGTIKFVNSAAKHAKKLATLGPDMLTNPPDDKAFEGRIMALKNRSKTLAEVLMDQSVVSGVGNYIKAEALYLSELSPHRVINTLTPNELQRLRSQIINVMKASYNTGGATINTYRNPDGTKGKARSRFVVYGNKTDPMGNAVIREETKDGRTTHWCPAIQR